MFRTEIYITAAEKRRKQTNCSIISRRITEVFSCLNISCLNALFNHALKLKTRLTLLKTKNKLNFVQQNFVQAEMYITAAKKRQKQTIFLLWVNLKRKYSRKIFDLTMLFRSCSNRKTNGKINNFDIFTFLILVSSEKAASTWKLTAS